MWALPGEGRSEEPDNERTVLPGERKRGDCVDWLELRYGG